MLLEARNLRKTFKNGRVVAVNDVSFSLPERRTLGIVGESGAGKSTLAKLILRLLSLDGGQLFFEGEEIGARPERALKGFRKKTQIVFQDPFLSLDPRMRVAEILKEPFLIQAPARQAVLEERVKELLDSVELGPGFARRRPHELSGGECQRVAIARAIGTGPKLIVCDEPVSALDALVQAQILNLLLKLQRDRGVSYLFISHDLKVVRHMSDEILVMRDGRV